MKKLGFLFLALIVCSLSHAQSLSKAEKKEIFYEGNRLLEEGLFEEAASKWKILYNADASNHNYSYKLGKSYLLSEDSKDKALPYLWFASKNYTTNYDNFYHREKKSSYESLFLLGKAYFYEHNYDSAKVNLVEFKSVTKKRHEYQTEIDNMLKTIDIASELEKNPVKASFATFNSVVNSKFPDYQGRVSLDKGTMLFNSKQELIKQDVNRKSNLDHYHQNKEDLYYSIYRDNEWKKASKISIPEEYDYYTLAQMSVDGTVAYMYVQNETERAIVKLEKTGKNFKKPEVIVKDFNWKKSIEQLTISYDESLIIFSHTDPATRKSDLYISKKNNDSWSEAEPLSNLNTEHNEKFPFISYDNNMLFFSSDRKETMGGYDLYVSNWKEDLWGEPENIGYPLNSVFDDYHISLSPNGKEAVISTNRYAKDKVGSSDITKVDIDDDRFASKINTLEIKLVADEGEKIPENATVAITSVNENIDFNVNPETAIGFSFIKKCGKYNFDIKVDDSIIITDSINVLCNEYKHFYLEYLLTPEEEEVPVKEIEIEIPIIKNVYFAFDKHIITPDFKNYLASLTELFKTHSKAKIEISGHTCNLGPEWLNKELSKRRAEKTAEVLISNGIDKSRIEIKHFGESKPAFSNETKDGRIKNRRAEIKIIQ